MDQTNRHLEHLMFSEDENERLMPNRKFKAVCSAKLKLLPIKGGFVTSNFLSSRTENLLRL